jgi:predicted MPP superfamily phosphohydrolase
MDCFTSDKRAILVRRGVAGRAIMCGGSRGLKAWPILGIAAMQAILLLAHWFLYSTWIVFHDQFGQFSDPAANPLLRAALLALGCSFIAAAMLGFHFAGWPVRAIYIVAAVWLGLFNFLFLAACLCWSIGFALRNPLVASILPPNLLRYSPIATEALLALAVLATLYGMVNARWIRVRRVPVRLPNLPESWRGRTALVLSDLHLGNINGLGFSRRIARLAERLGPEIVLIPGDLFDGVKADPDELLAPFKDLAAPFGIYFCSGNHDEFGGVAHYSGALERAGIRVLADERVVVDGLQIVGVAYGASTYPLHLRLFLERLRLGDGQASILLSHVPYRLPIVERAGVSLQLSGHTHGGQIFPFTLLTRRAFGKFTYGLQRFGKLQVYTSSGAGAWGPPMRVGTHPEAVLLRFE